MLTSTKMRGVTLSLQLLVILLLALSPSPCNGLCNLVNGTMAHCHDLLDAKYIDTYDLEILKTSVSEARLYPGIFRNLGSLRHLELSNGEVEHIDPGSFRSLPELRSLDLSHNMISSLEDDSFDGLKKLRSLSLRKNALTEIPTAVLHLKNLKILDLMVNSLNCSCKTLKVRDVLVKRGVRMSKRVLCSSPASLKGKSFLEPEVQVVCMFEEQDGEMQMDQPAIEGSGEAASGDPFDDISIDKLDEEEHDITEDVPATLTPEVETPVPTKSSEEEVAIAPVAQPTETSSVATTTQQGHDDVFFPEENKKRPITATGLQTSISEPVEFFESSTKETEEKSPLRQQQSSIYPVEGSGEEEDLREGSGIEGSGIGFVPPISWDVPDDETSPESSSVEPLKTTTEEGLLDMLWGVIAGTSAPPDESTKKDFGLEEEEFINVSSEPRPPPPTSAPVDEKIESPIVVADSGKSLDRKIDDDKVDVVSVGKPLDDAQSGKVRVEDDANAEATGASPARQQKQGMGSYVVLAALLAVLGALLGFAAYKGDYCKKKRKRNDVEGGTELKDMTKSLLESGNGAQPKIASNGNMENVPLVCTSPPDDSKHRDAEGRGDDTKMRYSPAPDVADPVKPPRKSFLPHEEPERAMTNGRSHQDLANSSPSAAEEPVSLRAKSPGETSANRGNRHDSVSSLGTDSRGSPTARTSPPFSSLTNGSVGTLQGLARPPLSPGGQRVKITLQENPDSVPKTPILITRTKAGENLVKTP